ncbi:DUF1254 domain-containing protein [Streptomyces sp. SR27]|uniref:DUF1254 domain-containing protein n=1 Tax=Streptomyces sp. SR27 TaxID=3076630 RepID=UPI00295ABD5F|nr:DUF1254 domain-containing protein [Streptomyces sp. SR27]MDV9187691.1 DUF1254 domain-containing protein [Streptomyces sp. SR27]
MTEDLEQLATEAYVYGFPLVFDLEQVSRFVQDGMSALPAAPFNVLSHASALAGPRDTFVSVNNDTVYSLAQLDLSGGPLLLRVPDTAGRYYVMQFVDAWTNNFAYLGRRATGTGAGAFLLTGPGWTGDVTDGIRQISAPTSVATIVGRWACAGPDDVAAVRALQQATTLEPFGAPGPVDGLPVPDAGVDEDLRFFEELRVWMRAFPPSPTDLAYQQRFAPLGLLEPATPYAEPDDGLARALRAGLQAGRRLVEGGLMGGAHAPGTGWELNIHAFDYNRDFFEVGTLDDPQWIIKDDEAAHLQRAGAARAGLWGNHGYEAAYAIVHKDGDGHPLDGRKAYTLRFDSPPPVDAFWSLTMYDTPDYYLVENPIDRYSIGDRTPGLHYADDGALTLYLQPDRPATPEAAANWLPTPSGAFRPILRMYQPRPEVLDGTYDPPPITGASPA